MQTALSLTETFIEQRGCAERAPPIIELFMPHADVLSCGRPVRSDNRIGECRVDIDDATLTASQMQHSPSWAGDTARIIKSPRRMEDIDTSWTIQRVQTTCSSINGN